jgi:hypothetical protein
VILPPLHTILNTWCLSVPAARILQASQNIVSERDINTNQNDI